MKRFLSMVGLACCGLVAAPVSIGAESGARGLQIEEIIVTARKREENIQSLGMSVSAMSQREIENNFARDLRDLVQISPNLVLDDTAQGPGGVAAAYIRGVGVSEVEKNFDPAVGVVVDGIFIGSMSGGIARMLDIERLEVLRGPQGTLFGRNTIGGVINAIRSRPTGELGGKIRASYGNYETSLIDGVFNFGIGDQWAVKLTGTYNDQGEGYFKNVNTGRHDGQVEYTALGANVLFTPTDGLELEVTVNREETDQDTPPLLYVGQPGQVFCDVFGFCAPSVDTPLSGDRWKTTQFGVGPNDASFDADTYIFEVRWDINDTLRLDYIVGRWETEETALTDWDATIAPIFHTSRPADYEQTSNELRLTYDAGGRFSGTAGVYLWESEYDADLFSFVLNAGGTIDTTPQFTTQKTDSWAVFFEGDIVLTDRWTLTVGGRYTEDEKDTDQTGNVVAQADEDWDEFTPRVGLRFQLNDDVMLYATYSAGYRAGGFNGRVESVENATTPYDHETVDNYELGWKSEWFDRRLQLNGAVFYMDYENKQEELQLPSDTSGTGQVTLVINASTADITGLELEAIGNLSERFSMRANLGLLDAEYDDFLFQSPTGPVDLSHLDLRRAPELTASFSGTYEWPIGQGTAWITGGWHYIDEHEVDFANKPELTNDDQHLINGSINYAIGNLQLSLYGHNLTDEDGYGIGFDVAGLWSYAATRAPRTYAFEVSYLFGD